MGSEEIDEDHFHFLMNCIPPIYIDTLDGAQIQDGFAVSEPYTHSDNAGVLTVCYKKNEKYHKILAEIYTPSGVGVWETYNHCHKRGYIAKTYTENKSL